MAQQTFAAASASDAETLTAISETQRRTGYLADPHTAVGLHVADVLTKELPQPVVALACAHPGKFPDTIERATGSRPDLPPALAELLHQPERLHSLPVDISAVVHFIAKRTHP